MPKYKFSWNHLPDEVARGLCWDIGLIGVDDDDPTRALNRRFGVKPSDEFITVAWGTLRERWLAVDRHARSSVVRQLRRDRVGRHEQGSRTAGGELRYLSTCTTRSKKMRSNVLSEFIAYGEVDHHDLATDTSLEDIAGWRLLKAKESRHKKLRPFIAHPHQDEAWAAMRKSRPLRGALLVLPTGAGKTVTAVRWLLADVLSDPDPRHVLWIAHRAELIEQAADTFQQNMDAVRRKDPLGIRCISGLHGYPVSTLIDARSDVVCATIQSLSRGQDIVEEYFRRHRDAVVVVDEAHHAAAKTYARVLEAARAQKAVEVLGLTATPTRTDTDELGQLAAQFPDDVVYQVETTRLIKERILAVPVCEKVETNQNFEVDFDESEVSYLRQFGDLSKKTLERIAQSTARNRLIADHYQQHQDVYGRTLIFCTGVAHCYTLSREFERRKIRAGFVAYVRDDGKTNEEVLSAFRKGRLDVLLSVTKLTEGVDLPDVQTALLTRPTSSHILLSQMVGRALRGPKANGTDKAFIVSFEDHWDRFADWLDPVDFVQAPLEEVEETEAAAASRIQLPWELFDEIARLRRPDLGAHHVDPTALVGWYDLSRRLSEPGELKFAPVFHHQLEGFNHLFSTSTDDRAGLASDEVAVEFFADYPDPMPSARIIAAVTAFLDEVGPPELRRFDDAHQWEPAAVAARLTDVTPGEVMDQIDESWEQTDGARLWGDKQTYFRAVMEAMALQHWKASPGEYDETIGLDMASDDRAVPDPHQWPLERIRDDVRAEFGLVRDPPPPIRFSDKSTNWAWAFYREDPPEIVVNRRLATRSVSRSTIEFLAYHELLHHELGVSVGHQSPFREREALHPARMEADAELDTWRDWWKQESTDG